MNFEIELKNTIKKKYGSVRAFAQAINTPYSTIDNIFKRGIMGVSIQVVLRICSELNIDIEKIQEDKLVIKQNNINFDEGHKIYEQLDDNDKAEIRGEMKQMLKANKYTNTPTVSDDISEELRQDLLRNTIHTK
ncbi:MAG: helix-turn-helix domain-containing protein [Oscillospiraceae bacterium]